MKKKSQRPYVLVIKNFEKNEKLLKNKKEMFKSEKEFSPLSGTELCYWRRTQHVA